MNSSRASQKRCVHLRWAIPVVLAMVVGCTTPPPHRPTTRTGKKPPATSRPYQIQGKWYHPLPDADGFSQTGIASWYGKKFHGRKTANGETYNMYGVSAAHKTLPLGIFVRVTHLGTGRHLDVRLNDRGPFVAGRVIDLSYGAAKELGLVGPGTARVRVEALGVRRSPAKPPVVSPKQPTAVYQPVDFHSGNFTFQVGAFQNETNARRLRDKLEAQYKNAHVVAYTHIDLGQIYAVRIGLATSLDQAESYKQQLRQNGFPGAFTIAE